MYNRARLLGVYCVIVFAVLCCFSSPAVGYVEPSMEKYLMIPHMIYKCTMGSG